MDKTIEFQTANQYNKKHAFLQEQSLIWEVTDLIHSTLNDNEWFPSIQIDVDWEIKEIFVEKQNFRIDSKDWKEEIIGTTKVKINDNADVIEYVEWDLAWEQLFTWNAAKREALKNGRRLLSKSEFFAIVEETWEDIFKEKLPWYLYLGRNGLWCKNEVIYFWLDSEKEDSALNIQCSEWATLESYYDSKNYALSVRCVKSL
jgi:hypothetical protein